MNTQGKNRKKPNLFKLSLPIIIFLVNMYIIPIPLILIGLSLGTTMWIKTIIDVLIIVGTIIFYKKNGIQLFNKVQFKWWYVLLPVAVVVVSMLKQPVMDLIFGGPQYVANGEAVTQLLGMDMVYTFIAAGLVAPVIEEVIFRGVIMGTFFEKNIWLGYIVSSVVFALIHSVTNLYSFVNYFSIGLLFGIVYKLTNKSLGWSIGAHMFNNIFFLVATVLGTLLA